MYFPGQFQDPRIKEYYGKLRERILLICEGIISETNWDTTQIDEYLKTFMRPRNFAGEQSAEIRHDRTFYELCYILRKDTGKDGADMTVMEFHQAMQEIKKRHGRKPNKNRRSF